MTTTKAWLDGDRFDLDDLVQAFADGDVRVIRDGAEGDYYLSAPAIDAPTEDETFYDAASRILRLVNGLGRVVKPDFRPVRLTDRYTTPEGRTHVIARSSGEGRIHVSTVATMSGPDGQPVPVPPPPWPAYFALAETDDTVARVLRILGSDERYVDWYDLYKVYELIGKSSVVGNGWASKSECVAFGASANNYSVSKDDARHAVDKSGTPRHTMTIDEGRSFISRVVTAWLRTL